MVHVPRSTEEEDDTVGDVMMTGAGWVLCYNHGKAPPRRKSVPRLIRKTRICSSRHLALVTASDRSKMQRCARWSGEVCLFGKGGLGGERARRLID